LHEIHYPTCYSIHKLQKEIPAPFFSYTNPNSIYPDIPRNSSWVEDKPFDEESILNMSDISESDKARMLPSYYSNNTIPVKEYILPPPPPQSLPASPPGSPPASPPRQSYSKDVFRRFDEVIEIAPDEETGKSVARVGWSEDTSVGEDDDLYLESASVAAGKGDSTDSVASNKARDLPSNDQKQRPRSLKVCVIMGCLVTLLCLIIITMAVTVSTNNKNAATDLSSAAVQSNGGDEKTTSATTVTPSIRATATPSAAATVAPSAAAVVVETAAPTESPTKLEAPWYDENATPSPTPNPTNAPTARPTEPLACVNTISTTQDCLDDENVLVVEFQNCNPQDGDWVGLYPDGSEFTEDRSGTEFLSSEWISWAWTCGDIVCENSPPSNSFSFFVDLDDPVYNLFNLRAYLVRANRSGPPFEVISKTVSFAVTDSCNA
jgi:hypothetical protein